MPLCSDLKSVLILTSEYYGSANMIGSHQLAKQLAHKGFAVYVVSFPISPLYYFLAEKTDYPRRKAFTKGFVEVEPNLHCYIPEVIIPPLPMVVKFVGSYLKHWGKLCIKSNRLIKQRSYDFVLTESLFYNDLYDQLNFNKLVFRLPDNLSGFWGDISALKNANKNLLEKADLVVSPSKQILEELPPTVKNIMHLPNGVRLDQYVNDSTIPSHFEKLTYTHHAIYVGAIQKWFDHKLLFDTARLRPDWSFTIIGKNLLPPETQYPRNVYFIGEIPNAEITSYLQHANVGIIPFETIENRALIQYVNPIKLYEYLAAGLAVISTRWTEIESLNAPITLIDTPQEFSATLQKLRHARDEVVPHEFLAQFDWSRITDSLLKEISDMNH